MWPSATSGASERVPHAYIYCVVALLLIGCMPHEGQLIYILTQSFFDHSGQEGEYHSISAAQSCSGLFGTSRHEHGMCKADCPVLEESEGASPSPPKLSCFNLPSFKDVNFSQLPEKVTKRGVQPFGVEVDLISRRLSFSRASPVVGRW